MNCYSCDAISQMHFVIQDRIDVPYGRCISFCCEKKLGTVPSTFLSDNPRENLERFIGVRHLEIIRGLSDDANRQDFACARCRHYIKKDWQFSTHILFVNMSIYPSPCQCRCFYCQRQGQPYNTQEYIKNNSDALAAAYEHAFDTLKLAKEIKLILPQETTWQVSCGEITIHPYKKEILDLVRSEKVCFYTNAFIFDKDIAQELHDNPAATINLSIDSGTADTWHKVKGVNNFNHVLENLKAYRKASARVGQITLKYIVMPGINDSDEDFRAFVDIVKLLDVDFISISRDLGAKREPPLIDDFFSKQVESAARLLAICSLNGLGISYFHEYTDEEQKCIIFLAHKLFEQMQ